MKSPDSQIKITAPNNWLEMWDGIKFMRKTQPAPVDTFGYGINKSGNVSIDLKAYHILINLMLSARTRDVVTDAATRYLITEQNLSVDTVLNTPEETLSEWISNVHFHRRKAKFIKETTQILKDKYQGKVPSDYEALIALPGVGQKMAHLVL